MQAALESPSKTRVSPRVAAVPATARDAAREMSRDGEAHGAQRPVLSADETAFIDQAFARILPEGWGTGSGAGYVERKLRAAALAAEQARPDGDGGHFFSLLNRNWEQAIYKAGIAAVQSYALRSYGRRFQFLEPAQQREVLEMLEAGTGFGGIGQFQVLHSMLANDAAEAYFEGSLR